MLDVVCVEERKRVRELIESLDGSTAEVGGLCFDERKHSFTFWQEPNNQIRAVFYPRYLTLS
jgi:hypothetical protein